MKDFILLRACFKLFLKTVDKYILCGLMIFGISGWAGILYAEKDQLPDLTQADRKEVTTRVAADADEWKNSGMVLKKGTKYKISAAGRWSLGPICGITGPDGYGNSAICGGVYVPGSGSLLVGRIGEEGNPFAIGKGIELTSPEDGVLFFSVNGGLKIFCSGYVNVTTTILDHPVEQKILLHKSDVDELPLSKAKPNKNAYAIVIGIEDYRQKLPRADFAVSDARLMNEYLAKVMGYPEENIVTLTNDRAALGDFVKYFEKWLPNNVEKGGTVFIYYSGHGAPNPKTGDAYLVPYDGDPLFIAETGYPLKRMYAALGKLQAHEIIVALDSCFSGAGGRSVIAKGTRPLVMNLQGNTALPRNMTVLAASSGEQISSTYDEKGHGLFTYFMLKGIKNEDVVKPDGSIKKEDLFDYIRPQVERIARKQFNNEQTPQFIGNKQFPK
ncbi:MAG: caspase domain-containing protein [Smithellaceae bacterium]